MQLITNVFLLTAALLSLGACTSVDEAMATLEKAQADSKIDTIKTQKKLKEMFTYNPKDKTPREVPHVYCYQVMQDILCYNQQIPGAEDRLVNWQGTGTPTVALRPTTPAEKVQLSNQTRYILTPPGARPSPGSSATGKPLKPLEPIFVGKMPEVKTEKLQINETGDSSIF